MNRQEISGNNSGYPRSHHITLTYLNIRQSIAILITKLVMIDFIMAFIMIGIYFVLVQGENFSINFSRSTTVFLSIFAVTGFIKILLTLFIVLAWLNEYYEINPENVVHHSGIIFKKTEMYALSKIRAMDVQDTFLGELLNFATISLYDIRLNKYMDMYLIHNPQRYAAVLRELLPNIEIKEDKVDLPFMSKKDLVPQHI